MNCNWCVSLDIDYIVALIIACCYVHVVRHLPVALSNPRRGSMSFSDNSSSKDIIFSEHIRDAASHVCSVPLRKTAMHLPANAIQPSLQFPRTVE